MLKYFCLHTPHTHTQYFIKSFSRSVWGTSKRQRQNLCGNGIYASGFRCLRRRGKTIPFLSFRPKHLPLPLLPIDYTSEGKRRTSHTLRKLAEQLWYASVVGLLDSAATKDHLPFRLCVCVESSCLHRIDKVIVCGFMLFSFQLKLFAVGVVFAVCWRQEAWRKKLEKYAWDPMMRVRDHKWLLFACGEAKICIQS